ncbi:centrosomal protein of 135 kDa isoform X2 [Tribolium madens]|uniref:centrosomal protein of 135 kDa isoform X2 n=1 Tax=Tribolium madens TaxID=41895 RepID=UPI001CF764CA|nr:centrosomal protein of 135 kDa isoform X2 [Tribolium madens]
MEMKAKKLRGELDELGYYLTFSHESVPLIEKLVGDLKTTTQSLQKYMKIAQNAIEERDNLQLGAEPYKCDNARLVKECNELHQQFLREREENEKIQRDLKRRLELLKQDNIDCTTEREKLKSKIKQLEVEIVNCGEILLNPKQKSKPGLKSASTTALIGQKSTRKAKNFELNSAMALADQKIANLSKDIKKLKEHNLQLIEANEVLQSQLNNRDKEIKRLNGLLEGGRPIQAIQKDCSCNCTCANKELHGGGNIQDQLNKVLQEKHILENRLKDALAKQHEAMKRCLHLAERNKLLEKEMKDIDHLALAVEAECNNTVKNNAEKVNRLQDRMQESLIQIQTLERENNQLKQNKKELNEKLDAITGEKKHLQTVLETSLEEKKRLTDKINNFTIIEHDLNMEIDRLNRFSAEQKKRIAELESLVDPKTRTEDGPRILSDVSPSRAKPKPKKKPPKKPSKSGSPVRPSLQVPTNTPKDGSPGTGRCCNCHCDSCSSSKHIKELLDKELEYKEQQAARCIDNLKSEKDYYMREYHKILEQMKNVPSRPGSSGRIDKNSELVQKLSEQEQALALLEHKNRMLSKEKFDLISKLESVRDLPDTSTDGPCLKATCKRTERERDLLRSDLERLEEERDIFRSKLKNVSEGQINEVERLKKRLLDSEEQIHRLEQERRELIQNHGTRRSTIDTLEEQCETLKNQLRTAQNELNQQRALYNQLKTLHEQTDRSLSDTQSKLVQTETELASALEHLKRREQDRGTVSKEVDLLKNDIQIMKTQLAQIDQEKDELLVALDDKTEKLAMMEHELKSREKTITSLESAVNEMKRKLGSSNDENANQKHEIHSLETELATLKQELDTMRKIKDSAIQENRRLQDDLGSVTCDCRDARKELELYKRQVDDLKTQLQHYVAEVKRTEDLISNKEIERNELLDQFRSLSHEANILETNNHTLETEATQSRVQLSVALDHAADLERKLDNKDSIIQSYEKQIADLTSQIASLEIQLRQCMNQFDKADEELQNMRDFSLKLESENARLKRQLRDRDDQRMQIDRNVDQLRNEREFLQHTVTRDRHNVESVERDLHDAKHETTELRILNRDLQEEVQNLKMQVQELKEKFVTTSEQLDMFQEKALEYAQQNKQLRREIANERFRRTRDSESSKYPSL